MNTTLGNDTDMPVPARQCAEILYQKNYDIFLSIFCAALIVFGLVYTFFGYKCFRVVMFLTGLNFGGVVVYLLCQDEKLFDQQVSFELAIGISVGIGVVCGLITLLVRYVGIFLQGFFLGAILAFTGIAIVQGFCKIPSIWICIGVLFVVGCLFAVLTLKFQKEFLIISTAVFGSTLLVACADYFLENFFLVEYTWKSLSTGGDLNFCWFTWMLVGSWFILSIVGIIIQWKVTAKNYDHTDVVYGLRRRKPVRTHLVREHQSPHRSPNDAPVDNGTNVAEEVENETPPSSPNELPDEDVERCDPPAFMDIEDEFDGPPPSYYECVELGIGEPVTSSSSSVLHTTAEVYPRHSVAVDTSASSNVPDELVRQMRSGTGYAVNDAGRSAHGRPSSVSTHSRSRSRSSSVSGSRSRHSTGSGRPRSSKHKKKRTNVKDNNPSRSRPQQNTNSRNDMQLLLVDSSRARSGHGAVAAHAERLRAAESRRATRQNTSQR